MKQILKEWRKYIAEEDNLEQNIYSFDYDETLIRLKPDPEDPEFSFVYDGPHEENIAKLRELAAAGHAVIIVTSRSKRTGDKHPWDTAPDPEELVAELGLPLTPVLDPGDDENEADEEPKTIHYTNGDLKAPKLLRLGVIEHWDDDKEELAAAEAAGITANPVPSALDEGAIAKWWANKLHEAGIEVAPRMKKYLKKHSYREPHGLQETN